MFNLRGLRWHCEGISHSERKSARREVTLRAQISSSALATAPMQRAPMPRLRTSSMIGGGLGAASVAALTATRKVARDANLSTTRETSELRQWNGAAGTLAWRGGKEGVALLSAGRQAGSEPEILPGQ